MQENKVDLHLIKSVKSGNKQAFNALVVKYQFKIIKIISKYVSDTSEALDITQEVFLRAYRALHLFRGESSFYTWLYRIAVNTAKNYLILHDKKPLALDPNIDFDLFLSQETVQEHTTPESLTQQNELDKLVLGCIDTLPHDLKTAVLLRDLEGLTYDEIAKIMSCPIGTVRSRIFRAREILEKKIQPILKNI